MDKGMVKGVVAGVLGGAVVGVGLALLFAPQSGRKTRREIQKRADDMKARADEFVANIKERDAEFCKAVREGADNYRKEMTAKIG
jgi:gas vesicle protein